MENAGKVVIYVERYGESDDTLTIKYHCEDGTARSGIEYHPVSGTLRFDADCHKQHLEIEIVDDDEPNPDRQFKVSLSQLKFEDDALTDLYDLKIGNPTTEVTIIDDDIPGIFQFIQPSFAATEKDT